jgi:hypothetical protein
MNDEVNKMLVEILASIRSLEERVARIEGGGAVVATVPVERAVVGSKRMSVKEFLIECKPSNAVQSTLAIAHYLEIYDGMTSFNVTDLEAGFRAAKETVPQNINDKINMCVKNGHIQEAKMKKDKKKAWEVTRTGEQYAMTHFGKIEQK